MKHGLPIMAISALQIIFLNYRFFKKLDPLTCEKSQKSIVHSCLRIEMCDTFFAPRFNNYTN